MCGARVCIRVIFVFMCVCVYVYVCVSYNITICVFTICCALTHALMPASCMHQDVCTHHMSIMYTCVCTSDPQRWLTACTYVCMCACMHACMSGQVCQYVYVCTPSIQYVSVYYVCVCVAAIMVGWQPACTGMYGCNVHGSVCDRVCSRLSRACVCCNVYVHYSIQCLRWSCSVLSCPDPGPALSCLPVCLYVCM